MFTGGQRGRSTWISRAIMERIIALLQLTRPTEQQFQDHPRDNPFFSSEKGTFQCDRAQPPMCDLTTRGENLYITLGGTDLEKFGESASANGEKLRLPKARSPSRLGGLGERRKLPSAVWGGAPEADAIFNILCQNGVNFSTC